MDKIVINGPVSLKGQVDINGSKNAVVAILPATLLAQGLCRIENIPAISDVTIMGEILQDLGAEVRFVDDHTMEIDTGNVRSFFVPHDLSKHLRASYYFLGALLGRFGRAKVSLPGGCRFGVRPYDLHLKGFELLGCNVSTDNGVISTSCEKLVGSVIYLDTVSVGATINIMLAAVKAKGLTIIDNAAREPHVVDLANFLNSMGADIIGAGTDTIKIHGVDELGGCTYSIIPDQIEAGTYMVAAAATRGDVLINNIIPKHLEPISKKLMDCGALVQEFDDAVRVSCNRRPLKCNIKTSPHPGFPTDMQPQMTTLLSLADGASIVSESVWDTRFKYVEQLKRMGANINVEGKVAFIQGVEKLNAAPVVADDLRAGAAMLIAGLLAHGTTEIEEIHHIDRGYEGYVEKLTALGADIKRISDHGASSQSAG